MADEVATKQSTRKRLLIAGGGIGGLTLAAALAGDESFEITVIERSQRALSGGAAIILWANAVSVLRTLGLGADVLSQSVALSQTEFRSAQGARLCELPIGQWSESSGAPSVVIRRASLIEILAARVPASSLRIGAGVRSFSQTPAGVYVELEDGETVVCDALVGADGLRSRVREGLHGTAEPRALPYQACVGIAGRAPADLEVGHAVAWLGRGPRFWAARLTGGQAFWYATFNSLKHHAATQSELLELFSSWSAGVRELIAATTPTDLVRTQVCDRLPIENWGKGAVTLLGDAAHPSTPDLGQGACQAIEGAIVLARCLASFAAFADGFREYERLRMPRTATISRLCALTWASSSVEGAFACSVRDRAMRFGLRAIAHGQLKWILAGQTLQP